MWLLTETVISQYSYYVIVYMTFFLCGWNNIKNVQFPVWKIPTLKLPLTATVFLECTVAFPGLQPVQNNIYYTSMRNP